MSASRFVAEDGTIVDVVCWSLSNHQDGQWFVVKHPSGILLGETRTLDGLAALGVDIATLTETKRGPKK